MEDSGGVSLPSGPDGKKRKVCYFYDPWLGDYNYDPKHPMQPIRVRITHNLILSYYLHEKLEINVPAPAQPDDIKKFHSDEYVDFLSSVSPETLHQFEVKRFGIGADCPVFPGLYNFCQASAGGSIGAALKLNQEQADIALNWAGGLHHAKRCNASGFCYVNDIVPGILELLKHKKRVLYVDIDVHHGDGVEQAFYTTDRVMTVSFHKYGDGFFPKTGDGKCTGAQAGKYYALNAPLRDGIDDESFKHLFRPVITKVIDVYQPQAVVLQCGADSLSGDRLGHFNLSIEGHADCLKFIRSFNLPLMVLGGGGYTVGNVARCWCYETAVAVGVKLENKLPPNEYYDYYGPNFTLHLEPGNMRNKNSKKYLEELRNRLLDQLSKIVHAPSVPFQARPPDTQIPEEVVNEGHMDGMDI